jgi:hypothetical protein
MNTSNKLLMALAASFVVDGVIEALLASSSSDLRASTLVHGAIIGVLCYLWVRADGVRRSCVPPGRSALYAGLFPIVGIPAYFFRTRDARQALFATGKALIIFVGLSAIGESTIWAVHAARI